MPSSFNVLCHANCLQALLALGSLDIRKVSVLLFPSTTFRKSVVLKGLSLDIIPFVMLQRAIETVKIPPSQISPQTPLFLPLSKCEKGWQSDFFAQNQLKVGLAEGSSKGLEHLIVSFLQILVGRLTREAKPRKRGDPSSTEVNQNKSATNRLHKPQWTDSPWRRICPF